MRHTFFSLASVRVIAAVIVAAPLLLPLGVQAATVSCRPQESQYVNVSGKYRFCYDSSNWYVATKKVSRREANFGFVGDEVSDATGAGGQISFDRWSGTLEKYAASFEASGADPAISGDPRVNTVQSVTIAGRKAVRVTMPAQNGTWATTVVFKVSASTILRFDIDPGADKLKAFNRMMATLRF